MERVDWVRSVDALAVNLRDAAALPRVTLDADAGGAEVAMRNVAVAASCGTMTIRVEGIFDPPAAAKTLARIADLACDHIVVDLSRAWEISDIALAFLAGGLARLPRSKGEVSGLRPHHECLLQELGAASLVGRPRHSEHV